MKRSFLFVCLFIILLLAGIPIAAATPVVSGISPSTGPNDATSLRVTVTGSGFTSSSVVYLYKCGQISAGGSQRKFTGTIQSVDSNKIVATFSLTGKKVGDYGVIVGNPITTGSMAGYEDDGYKENIFVVYQGTGTSGTTATTTTTTETVTTTTTSADGANSVFFETDPSGAEIWLDGEEIGTSAFTYNTNKDGVFDVVVKKIGFEDYEAKVTILKGKRVHFYAPLTIQSSSGTTPSRTVTATKTPTKTAGASANATAGKTPADSGKPTVKIPTPLGTDPPTPTEESPVNPATVLLATVLGVAVVVLRRH
jgi:hypothetical protein